jgi:tRNA A-37 threonylcarbamoyl transferase component Bud32
MALNAPIALGFTAEIYAWKDDQVLKLFNQGISRNAVETEGNLTRIVCASGLPVPAVGEIIEIDGRYGLEYERVDGMTMLQALLNQPWKFPADLHADMHKRRIPELPSQRQRLERKIKEAGLLTENLRQAALHALEQLPDNDKLCHGDFHPNNIVLSSHGPVIIDWMDASRGSPIMDVARSTLLFGGGPIPPGTPLAWLVKLLRRWSYQIYLRRYFQLNSTDQRQLSTWVPVAAAARLDENITADEGRLLSIAQKLLEAG